MPPTLSSLLSLPLLLLATTLTLAQAQVIPLLWNTPNGTQADFAVQNTYTAGQHITLSWNALDLSEAGIDTSAQLLDLWVAAFDVGDGMFNKSLAQNINLTVSAGAYDWNIAIPDAYLSASARYVLQFKPQNLTYDPDSAALLSPGILVLNAVTTTSTSSAAASATVAPSGSASARGSAAASTTGQAGGSSGGGLSGGAKAGIAVGVLAAVFGAAGGIGLLVMRRRRRRRGNRDGMLAEKDDEVRVQNKHESAELPASSPVSELPASSRLMEDFVELPAD